ncbi:unnamed protein product [Meganyctiphanes norvegica]|uniref:Secernin-2 n=1 Tax=Meganyctiphanes norvegica TaxID=48144 RepID=A0AAV2RAL9_MEGNR
MSSVTVPAPPPPQSCDTFVVLGDKTNGGHVVFGKNSDRPSGEVQEVIYQPSQDHGDGETLECTYISIPQISHTHAVILSKPSWMWGAEMGSNDQGVAVGNEAVWTKMNSDDDLTERLLGMDFVRLALERGSSAEEAKNVITSLLEEHGQGGPCSDSDPSFTYHNSYLITDNKEAWVLETAGKHWAAQKVTSGHRNISNKLSIGSSIDDMSSGLKEKAQEEGWWDGSGDFNFMEAYGTGADAGDTRKECGEKLLENFSQEGSFDLQSMFKVLRDEPSGICMSSGAFVSTGSQVSVLSNSGRPSCHWFTGTPDPQTSVFKPFIFTQNVKISPYIQSPKIEEDPAKTTPRFAKTVDRSHLLYRRQQTSIKNGDNTRVTLQELEKNCVAETESILDNFDPEKLSEMDDLFKDCVDSELKFYK